MAEVDSARVDEVACTGHSPAQPSVPARFRAVRLESEGYPKQQAVSCIQSIFFYFHIYFILKAFVIS